MGKVRSQRSEVRGQKERGRTSWGGAGKKSDFRFEILEVRCQKTEGGPGAGKERGWTGGGVRGRSQI